ncbi:MAG: cysteine desulfurase [Verrucomicrobia bacterium]|nr:cysteine desulfurase [Verrucomicrobiota bacterium]
MTANTYPIDNVRADFPALRQTVNGCPLTYLDNAATTLKPEAVVEAVRQHYREESANIHRGVHHLSQKATEAYEAARDKVQHFLHAEQREEIIFTSGTTAAINTVAHAFGSTIHADDEIILSEMEHHSNIVPWQMLRERTGCVLRVIPITDDGQLDLAAYEAMLGPRTKLVSVVYVSNSLGTVNPVQRVIDAAHAHGAKVLVDAAQAVACRAVDVRALDCDFLAFSGHKIFGPTGVGVLYGKRVLLDALPPFFGGGDMILSVSFERTTYNALPYKFEAGTPHIAGVIGLGAALDYVNALGLAGIAAHEEDVRDYATRLIARIPGVRLYGTAPEKAAILSFVLEGVHPHDVGQILDTHGVAVRAGHHCTQPVMQRYGIPATARASFSIYNTRADADRLAAAIMQTKELFG